MGAGSLLGKLARDWDRLLFRTLYLDRGGDQRDTVMVAGSGRSGTTWLASLVNFNKDFRTVFEPFHKQKVPSWKDFSLRHYLRPENGDPLTWKTVGSLLLGRPRNRWMDSYNRTPVARKRIVKAIRANLMLGYICRNFPQTKILFITRHPCAVASSRQRLGWDSWETSLDIFLDQEELVEDFLSDHQEEIKTCTDPLEKELWFWAVENLVPFRQLEPGRDNVLFLSYESLLTESEREMRRVLSFLELQEAPGLWQRLDRDSGTSWREGGAVGKEERLRGWEGDLKEEQLDRAMDILATTGLHKLYGREPMPLDHPFFS